MPYWALIIDLACPILAAATIVFRPDVKLLPIVAFPGSFWRYTLKVTSNCLMMFYSINYCAGLAG